MVRLAALGVAAALVLAAAAGSARQGQVNFRVFVHTGIRLGDVLWTGRAFLYVAETTGEIVASDADGSRLRSFARLPPVVEEFRCRVSPGAHGFAPGDVYCHSPDNVIYRISPDAAVSVFARLNENERSDGALAFDTVGRFGYGLLAATGRSGTGPGGKVFVIGPGGRTRLIGSYPGPGGAENIAVGSPRFGRAAGAVLISIDWEPHGGRLLAMTPLGRVFTVARGLGDGIDPIAVIGGSRAAPGDPAAGFYVTDTLSTDVLFAPATAFAPYRGGVIVGTERTGLLWAVVAAGKRSFRVIPLETSLPKRKYNLEGATWVGG